MEERIGHQFGNFHQYYDFHNSDDRVSTLPSNFFASLWEACGRPECFVILDIGCNEGDLSMHLLNASEKALPGVKCSVIGVDLDDVLIEKATKKYNSHNAHFLALNVVTQDLSPLHDLIKEHCPNGISLVTAFSITMWIHVNHGDDGLRNFLTILYNLTSSDILVEPQLWKSYRTAAQRCRRLNLPELPYYQILTMRDTNREVESYLSSLGCDFLWKRDTKGWGRALLLFRKKFNGSESNSVEEVSQTSKRLRTE